MSKQKLFIEIGVGLLAFVAGIIAFATADRPSAPARTPPVIVESFDPSLWQYEAMWRDEIARRPELLPAVAVLVHGGDFEEGRWIVGASLQPWKHISLASDLARSEQAKYPGRTIVFLACNPGHLPLGVPGVYYARSSVWCVPDRALTPEMMITSTYDMHRMLALKKTQWIVFDTQSRWQTDPDVVGNIFEFVKD